MTKSGMDGQFVTEADWIPTFWNFLVGLNRDDLIAELIQNDLDQDATRTVISFEEDRLVCEGNGKPVDDEGWQRLRKIQGAGDSVPAKRGKIGVKNHGLKTAFTIGDELLLMSAGKAIVQTLHAKGRNQPPYPGASKTPAIDQEAPLEGCRVVIRYRNTAIEPAQGEAFVLRAINEEDIDKLFQQACSSIPEQFSGIVTPGNVNRYEIVLRHWRLGEAEFRFSCTRVRKIAKRMELFRRQCEITGTMSPLPESLKEQAVRRFLPLKGRLRQRVPDFYRRGRYFFAEVSWLIDGRGRPKVGTGRFRYPIGYPQNSQEALTGHGAYFNVPVVSNTERRAPVTSDESTMELRAVCEELLVDALARYAIQQWGPDGLNPLVPSSESKNGDEIVRPLLAVLAKRGAMPVMNWRNAVGFVFKGRKDNPKATLRRIMTQRGSGETKQYRFVLPVATWAEDSFLPALSLLSPCSEMQLDPRTHADIISILADNQMPGSSEDFSTFNEEDVFNRVIADGNQRFGPIVDREREFAEPIIARSYLDLVKVVLEKGNWDRDEEEEFAQSLLLPDVKGKATTKTSLYSSAPLPYDLPGLRLPPILHPNLIGHPIFRRPTWRLPKYTMAKFLAGDTLRVASEDIRSQFWQWLCRNNRLVPARERSKLAGLAIWPDESGKLAKISELCSPRSRHVSSVLAESIRLPSKQVRNSKLVSVGNRAHTSIRSVPTDDEVADWLNVRLTQFVLGITPDAETIKALHRFEDDLIILTKDKAIFPMLKALGETIPALSQDGSLQSRTSLVKPGQKNDQLALPKRFLINERPKAAYLDKLSQALITPSASMILDALAEDSSNFSCLQPRLKQLLNITEQGTEERERLATLPIIPLDGRICEPSELAFIGNRGDYWGNWKKKLPGTGLSQDDQRRFREAGVTSGAPNAETSLAFFKWLSTQNEKTQNQHIPCVVRHILHREGPKDWVQDYTDIPFIPAKSRNGLRLVSLQTMRKGSVYLSDAGDIGDTIISNDPRVLLVIERVKEVTHPITEQLRELGVRSLREALTEPRHVFGVDNILQASDIMIDVLHGLSNAKIRSTFLKRLVELGVESYLIRHDWYDRLGRIKKLQVADKVEASYRFRGKDYRIGVNGGFDPGSGVFWIKNDGSDGPGKLYTEIAKRLVFKPAAQPMHHFMLEHAVSMEINDPSFGRSSQLSGSSDIDNYVDGQEIVSNGETTEAIYGHSPFKPDNSRNLPKPSPIPENPSNLPSQQISRTSEERLNKVSGAPVTTPAIEKEHKEILKLGHYASHCQMCLCERTPQELAPEGSYIFAEEVRRSIVEAHHVDLKSAGGARHAGNMILLCKLHHNNFGPRLTRIRITSALRGDIKRQVIKFGPNTEVMGRQIEYVIPDTGEVVRLFFTDHHAEFWLAEGQVI